MNWQVPAAGAALGFVFSLLGGLIGGVGFLDLVLRGFLGALIMGGLTGGLQFLLARFLPELFEAEGPAAEVRDEDSPQVDITVGEGDEEPAFEELAGDEPPRPQKDPRPGPELPSFGSQVEDMGDDLPDVGGLSPMAYETSTVSASAPVAEGEEPLAPARSVEFEGQQEDPALLARAVQTVLKREGDK